MQRKTKLANRKNYGNKRALSAIQYIVLHFTANDGDSDEANGNYFTNNVVKASAHIFVDDDSATQSVPDDYVAWSVGGNKYSETAGGSLHGKCTNANSLSIEMCDTVKNGVIYPTEKTLANTAEIVKEKMQQYNIPLDHVIRHYDVTGKKCPAYFVNDAEWKKFKERLQGGWVKDSKGWWYKNPDGSYPVSTWKKINGKWYYFDERGYMVTGWKLIDGAWYYLDPNGAMYENRWLKDNNKWYWLKANGHMAKSELLNVNGKYYAFLADGHMATTDASGALN